MNSESEKKRTADRRVRKTKKALRESLVTLMAQKNTRDISVQELSDLADVNRATFYLHYKDIYELQQQIEDDTVHEINAILDQHLPVADAHEPYPLFITLLSYIKENAALCEMLLGENGNGSFLAKLCTIVEQRCLHTWLEQHRMKNADEELAYFSSYMIYGYVAIISKWTQSGMRTPPEQLAEMMANIGLYGVDFLEHTEKRK